MNRCRSQTATAGFSLVELAVVLVIIGLMLGGLLIPLGTQIESDKRKENAATLESIKDALIGFAIINQRLPCPDTNADGREDCPSVAPDGGPKGLPFADLGVSRNDAWGNPWLYAVTNAFTLLATPIDHTTVGNINVGTTNNGCANALLARNVPALVWSNGKTDNGGVLEGENTGVNNSCYIDADYRQVAPLFDDMLVWIPPGLLLNRMAAAGRLPSP